VSTYVPFYEYTAPSVIAERERKRQESERAGQKAEEAEQRVKDHWAVYAEIDRAYEKQAAESRRLTERARKDREEIERQAKVAADKMEHDEIVQRRAKELLAERDGFTQTDGAMVIDVVPRTRVTPEVGLAQVNDERTRVYAIDEVSATDENVYETILPPHVEWATGWA
jgi:hypothetical protein